jgi:AcrR family transcriptional regulator
VSAGETRAYHSPLREQRAAQTRERIVSAGAEILRGTAIWNWHAVTVRAVAEHAGVNARTVYRHFATERDLRDAVLRRLEEESGIQLEGLRLEDIADFTARVFGYVSAFPVAPRTARDATMREAYERLRAALLTAVASAAPAWPEDDRTAAAAGLDILWSVESYERLVTDWDLDPKAAIRALTWLIRLLEDAIRENRPPPS